MRSVLFVALFSQIVIAQYDDLSILEEVLTRTSQRPIIRQLPSEVTMTTVDQVSSTTEEIAISTSTAGELVPETTPEHPSTTEEVSSPSSTDQPIIAESTTFPVIESTEADEMLFMGMKRPDLATIYRRLFPF